MGRFEIGSIECSIGSNQLNPYVLNATGGNAMFLIKQGHIGPRVIMIQGILRSLGYELTIDGNFGPKTKAAVQNFQRRPSVKLSPDGKVGMDTWQTLRSISGYRVINVVDAEDPAQRKRVMGGLNRALARDVIIMYGQSNAIASAISQIMSRVNASGTVAMVRLYSHGAQGAQNVAAGKDGSMMAHRSGFTTAMLPQIKTDFSRLNDVLASFGCLDLMGCSVGGGVKGQRLLSGLANAVRRPAEGGMRVQYSTNTGYVPFNFEGAVRHVYPRGVSRKAWGRSVQNSVPVGHWAKQ